MPLFFKYMDSKRKFLSDFPTANILILICAIVYWAYDKELGKLLIINLTSTSAVNTCIKGFVGRMRPYATHTQIKCLHPPAPDVSINDPTACGFSFLVVMLQQLQEYAHN